MGSGAKSDKKNKRNAGKIRGSIVSCERRYHTLLTDAGVTEKGAHIARRSEEKDNLFKLVYGGLGFVVVIAAMVLPYMLFFSSAGITYLTTEDMTQLKTVFYGGDPWLVTCQQERETMHDVVTKSLSPLAEAGVKVGVVQCSSLLPSNKTISERFKLTKTKPFTAFLCVNGVKPVQVPAEVCHFVIDVQLRPYCILLAYNIVTTQPCYSRKFCAIVVKGGELSSSEMSLVDRLSKLNRDIAFNVINTQLSKFSLSKRLPDDEKSPLLVMVKKVTGGDGDTTSAVKLHKAAFEKDAIMKTLALSRTDPIDEAVEFKILKKRPTVKPRRKKTKESYKKHARSSKKKDKATSSTKDTYQNAYDGKQTQPEHNTNSEGMVSEAERTRRKQLDEEMESMIQATDADEIEEDDYIQDEDDYEEVIAADDEYE